MLAVCSEFAVVACVASYGHIAFCLMDILATCMHATTRRNAASPRPLVWGALFLAHSNGPPTYARARAQSSLAVNRPITFEPAQACIVNMTMASSFRENTVDLQRRHVISRVTSVITSLRDSLREPPWGTKSDIEEGMLKRESSNKVTD